MKERWTDLNATSDTRTTMLEEAVKLTIEYQENRSHFVPWLDEAERRVDAIHLTCDDKALETHKQHVEVMKFVSCCCKVDHTLSSKIST